MDWHREGADLDQMMLALSTYLVPEREARFTL
jgi:hypothetical protein